ncbi:MAG: 23S rRNA (uracil(1939)-C(5))-methyltransferase RlmD [Desulfuromonas sp.]|nr:MAG: 23S rRNA (uracil(1939)-C(5))-methyltransferase RlmD [Desulfuromonas sp.]
MPELTVESLATGGEGVGRFNGKTVFVPLTAPGDRVRFEVVQEKKRYLRGRMTERLDDGSGRRRPPCPVFGECGGCDWQHLAYTEQAEWKQRLVQDVLHRIGGVQAASELPILPAVSEWGYRSRVQFKCHATSEGMAIGFFRRGSHFVIDIVSCPIADERINHLLVWLRPILERFPVPETIPQVDVELGADGQARMVVHQLADAQTEAAEYLARYAAENDVALFMQTGRKSTLQHLCGPVGLGIEVDDPPLRLLYDAGGFAQVNAGQNRLLVDEVVRLAALVGTERVIDLYCGMGNLSLPLARRSASLVGIEAYQPAIVAAEQNAKTNRVENCRFLVGDAMSALPRLLDQPCDLLVLDPPRQGAKELNQALAGGAHLPTRLLYVSCDPATLARDVKGLTSTGYHLSALRPIDMFPQTHHVETIALLELE